MNGATHRSCRKLSIAALFATTALGAGSAFAQTAPDPNSQSGQVQEIVVTAEKRAVSLQQVPVSVTAVTGETLRTQGLENLADYAQYVPGLTVTEQGSAGQTNVTIRGIANLGPGATVGYYLDDTPLGSSGPYTVSTSFGLDLLPYDLKTFEVDRGPQGTLYGASAMGGIIKYSLIQADPNKFSAQIGGQVDYIDHSNDPGYGVRGAVNIPLIEDKLGIRFSGFDQRDQGYINNVRLNENGVNGADQYGGRVALTWNPLPKLKINLNAIFYRLNSDDQNTVTLGNVSQRTISGGAILATGSPTLGDYTNNLAYRQPFTKDIDYYSGTINWDLGPVTAISATSWSHTRADKTFDESFLFGEFTSLLSGGALAPGLSVGFHNLDLDKFTQEVRLVSPTGGFIDWIVGAFYTKETSSLVETFHVADQNYQPITGPFASLFNPFLEQVDLPSTFQEYAGFGDLTLHLTPQADLSGGVRVSHNDQVFSEITHGNILPGGVLVEPGNSGDTEVTWQVNGRYRFTHDVMAYFRVATGYQPGGPNPTVSGVPAPNLQPSTLTNYEAGIKSTFWDGKARFNISVYDIDWKDIQLNVFFANTGTNIFGNGGEAYSRGVEIEGSVTPIRGLQIGYDVNYDEAKLTSNAANASPPFVLGYQLPGVPEWTAGVTADYAWTLPNSWQANVGGGVHYIDQEWNSAPEAGQIITQNPSYTEVDLHAGVTIDRYNINLFVKNLFDKNAYLEASPLTNPATLATPALSSFSLQPRMVGVSVDAKF